MPAASEEQREFPCPGCGSNVVYAPPAGLLCPHCGHAEKIPRSAEEVREFSFEAYLRSPRATGQITSEGKDVECKHCGAQTHVAGDVESLRCAFCGTPLVLEDAKLPACIRPEAVVPFTLSAEQALERFRAWAKGLWFAPTELKRAAAPDRIVGIYRPYWTFDSDTYSWYTGERGDAYYETEYYTDSEGKRQSREVRKIRWTRVSGQVSEYFDDILVQAGKPMEWNSSYRIDAASPYDARFLAGWSAERYTIPPERAWPVAKSEMDDAIRGLIRQDIGGDEQRIDSVRTQYNAVTFKHLLLPLYISSYIYRSRTYTFQVNGQTGEVRGHRPYSFWKILFLILAILGLIGGILLLVRLSQSDSRHSGRISHFAEINPISDRFRIYASDRVGPRKEADDEGIGSGDRGRGDVRGGRVSRLGRRDRGLGRDEAVRRVSGAGGILPALREVRHVSEVRQVRRREVRRMRSRGQEVHDVRRVHEVRQVRHLQDGLQRMQEAAHA